MLAERRRQEEAEKAKAAEADRARRLAGALTRARAALEAGRFEEASGLLGSLPNRYPDNPDVASLKTIIARREMSMKAAAAEGRIEGAPVYATMDQGERNSRHEEQSMRLVTFRYRGEEQRLGMVREGQVIEVAPAAGAETMLDVIRAGWTGVLPSDGAAVQGRSLPLEEVSLCAPIPRPESNVICLGRNYAEHAAESARARNEEVARPTFFSKAVTSINGPYGDIPYDASVSSEIDWEVELAVVVGRRARRVRRQDALSYVFGYTVLNDVSARDLQNGYGGQFFYGKSLDGACPTGPWIVTADEIPDPQHLTLRLRVNGELRQEDTTRSMIVGVAEIIEILSQVMTLQPGQIIATGTPAGVGHGRQPPQFLRPGDVMESEIEQIGTMRNRVVEVA